MTKPDDIPQDVWGRALSVKDEIPYGEGLWFTTSTEAVARAIMAEREACSVVTGAMVDAGAHELEARLSMPWEHLCEIADEVLQAAIRNRGAAD